MKGRKQFMIRHNAMMQEEAEKELAELAAQPNAYSALEMEAATALLMLRYQYTTLTPVTAPGLVEPTISPSTTDNFVEQTISPSITDNLVEPTISPSTTDSSVEQESTTTIPGTESPTPTTVTESPSPPPAPPVEEVANVTATTAEQVETDKCTPKEQVRSGPVKIAAKPLKKRSIPPHLLSRTLTPAKSSVVGGSDNNSSSCSTSLIKGGGGIVKAKLKAPAAPCNKALLKTCRNMIREFLDNQELI